MTDTAEAGATLRRPRPQTHPARPYFSSGPCAKPPGWSASLLHTDPLGRSHRGALGKARLAEAIERTHALLDLPSDYRLGIVPAEFLRHSRQLPEAGSTVLIALILEREDILDAESPVRSRFAERNSTFFEKTYEVLA